MLVNMGWYVDVVVYAAGRRSKVKVTISTDTISTTDIPDDGDADNEK